MVSLSRSAKSSESCNYLIVLNRVKLNNDDRLIIGRANINSLTLQQFVQVGEVKLIMVFPIICFSK